MNRNITATVMAAALTLACTAVIAGASAPVSAATTRPAHFNAHDRLGCHVAYEISRHGLSGVPIPAATEVTDLQVTEVFGTRPYKQDARAVLHQITTHRPYRRADLRMVRACGRHH